MKSTKVSEQLPPEFITRLQQIVGAGKYEEVLRAFATVKPTTLRVNTLKSTKLDLLAVFKEQGVSVKSVPWWNNAFILDQPSLRELTQLNLYENGWFYVQSLSSMIPPLVLNPQKGDIVLDITAAPGSKTTQLAMLMENQGKIIASDISPIRLLRLEANCKRQGVTIAEIKHIPGQRIWFDYPEIFDKALVDVPCSMEGTISLADSKTFRHWSMKKIKQLSYIQKTLLRSAISATKVGGTVVYSTCTLAPEENEGVIDWVLKKMPGKIKVEPIHINHLEYLHGLTSFQGVQFAQQVSQSMRIVPTKLMEGFFIAKLTKIASTIGKELPDD